MAGQKATKSDILIRLEYPVRGMVARHNQNS